MTKKTDLVGMRVTSNDLKWPWIGSCLFFFSFNKTNWSNLVAVYCCTFPTDKKKISILSIGDWCVRDLSWPTSARAQNEGNTFLFPSWNAKTHHFDWLIDLIALIVSINYHRFESFFEAFNHWNRWINQCTWWSVDGMNKRVEKGV